MGQEGTRRYRRPTDPGAEQFARLQHFADVVAGDPASVPLDRAALALAAVLRSRPVDSALVALDELAAGCPDPTFDGLRRHLFDEHGYAGDDEEYDDPRNSMLDVVLARRRGLPILLATVMIEVGRRAGIGVVGVGMPMHFLVRSGADADAFVDPFTGELLDRVGARGRFAEITGGRVPWDDDHLEPTPSRLIVVRILSNLQGGYQRRHDTLHQALVGRMRASIPELHDEAGQAARLGAVLN